MKKKLLIDSDLVNRVIEDANRAINRFSASYEPVDWKKIAEGDVRNAVMTRYLVEEKMEVALLKWLLSPNKADLADEFSEFVSLWLQIYKGRQAGLRVTEGPYGRDLRAGDDIDYAPVALYCAGLNFEKDHDYIFTETDYGRSLTPVTNTLEGGIMRTLRAYYTADHERILSELKEMQSLRRFPDHRWRWFALKPKLFTDILNALLIEEDQANATVAFRQFDKAFLPQARWRIKPGHVVPTYRTHPFLVYTSKLYKAKFGESPESLFVPEEWV